MSSNGIGVSGLAVLTAWSGIAVAQSTTQGAERPPLMDRQKEIALALSACPPPVATKAAVYALEKSGYVKARASESGFVAIVQHSMPTSHEPQCMDAEGARTFLPRMLRVAELAQGMNSEEIQRIITDAT